MTVRSSTLPNGMTVITDDMPHLESASLGIWVKAGSRSEAASRAFAREKRVENNRAAYFRLLLEPLYGPAHQS